MDVDKLATPCGTIAVTQNGQPVFFEVIKKYDSMFHLDENSGVETEVYPHEHYEIRIPTCNFSVGDHIFCRLDSGILERDGGGEFMLNACGRLNGFDIALGAPDTYYYEDGWQASKASLSSGMNANRCLCYVSEHCPDGFEFEIVDNPKLYVEKPHGKYIALIAVWCNSEKAYAYDVVSFFTI